MPIGVSPLAASTGAKQKPQRASQLSRCFLSPENGSRSSFSLNIFKPLCLPRVARIRSFNEATAGTNSAAQPDQPARVIKRLSFLARHLCLINWVV